MHENIIVSGRMITLRFIDSKYFMILVDYVLGYLSIFYSLTSNKVYYWKPVSFVVRCSQVFSRMLYVVLGLDWFPKEMGKCCNGEATMKEWAPDLILSLNSLQWRSMSPQPPLTTTTTFWYQEKQHFKHSTQ